jgi:hypothetical protein
MKCHTLLVQGLPTSRKAGIPTNLLDALRRILGGLVARPMPVPVPVRINRS